ncbi:MAG: hypothetical protein LUB83_04280 [Prevotellaceae bacterium]|nr:hypothetical protein [Prevotellaceae bacterium]
MKALLPAIARPMGYFLIVLALLLYVGILFQIFGNITDANLAFYKECIKLIIMIGALMILFSVTKNEDETTEQIRSASTRNAMFFTVLYIFIGMLIRKVTGDLRSEDTSSFIVFFIINVLCLEFGLKKRAIDTLFKGKRR